MKDHISMVLGDLWGEEKMIGVYEDKSCALIDMNSYTFHNNNSIEDFFFKLEDMGLRWI